jgi:predicted TIM-barrel fold metal-dependent hydrolase
MKTIDAHCHLHKTQWLIKKEEDFLLTHFNKDCDEQTILDNMKEAGIEKTVIFPLPSIFVDIDKANHYVVTISKKFPGDFIPFTIIDNKPGYWVKQGVKGFKEHSYGQRIQKDASGRDIFSQKFKETYKYMEQNKIPLLLHAGVNRVERLEKDIFKDTPELFVILAHLGADFPEGKGHLPQQEQVKSTLIGLKNFSNLYFDISAVPNPAMILDALAIVGSKKLIFGSDFPNEPPKVTLQRLLSLKNICSKDLENILYNNINEILTQQELKHA